jgi:glycosyltransferase domain-containing protein
MSPLTIVLPIKDRHDFTRRFLHQQLPYKILIADGSKNKSSVWWSDLDVEYIAYPHDETLSHYHTKMADALSRVTTPYAMLADDDDFVLRSGTDKAIEFLDNNPDYVCCGGGLGGFSLYGNSASGKINRWSYRYTLYDKSLNIGQSSALDRLRYGARNWWSYYAVFRTSILQTITQEIKEIDFSELQLREFYYALRTLTLGKAYSDPTTMAHFRQYYITMGGFEHDWVHRLLRSNFNRDISCLIDRISSQTENAEQAKELLLAIFEQWLIEFLTIYYGSLQDIKQKLRDHAPRFYNWLKNRRRFDVASERIRLFDQLSIDGATTEYLTTFRSELEAMISACR